MDYNSTFLGLIVAGVILVAIGFGLVLTQPAALRPASAVIAIDKPAREPMFPTTGEGRTADRQPGQTSRLGLKDSGLNSQTRDGNQ